MVASVGGITAIFPSTHINYSHFKFYLFLFILFLAVLGLRCHTQAFSSCSNRGATPRCGARASHCGGLSC